LGLVAYDLKEYSLSNNTGSVWVNSASGTNFIYSAILGASYSISKDTELDLSYSYVDYGTFSSGHTITVSNSTTSVTTSDAPELDWKAHEFLLALRYHF